MTTYLFSIVFIKYVFHKYLSYSTDDCLKCVSTPKRTQAVSMTKINSSAVTSHNRSSVTKNDTTATLDRHTQHNLSGPRLGSTAARKVPSLRRNLIAARKRLRATHLSVACAYYCADSCDTSNRGLTFRTKQQPDERPLDTDRMVYFLSHTRHFMKWRGISRNSVDLLEKLAL